MSGVNKNEDNTNNGHQDCGDHQDSVKLVESKINRHFSNGRLEWNLDIKKGQGTSNICSLQRGFVISTFVFIYFAVTGVKKIICYTENFVIW